MARISNDHDLRDALNKLTAIQQRVVGADFAKSVIHLCMDERVRRAMKSAQNPDAGDAELEDALRAAKGYAAKTYTACGKDTDWLAQADHFVAAADPVKSGIRIAASLDAPGAGGRRRHPDAGLPDDLLERMNIPDE